MSPREEDAVPLLQPPGPQRRASQAQPSRGQLAQTAWGLTAYLPHSVPPDTATQGPPHSTSPVFLSLWAGRLVGSSQREP
ncbi:unnamed protein product [Rangifer tarandus platyrhynchus]|uniref:Uncharacterized protein n=1 Tax=Rangifer tarandus platyrhynchus TaxID=3082113 RepID=A0ABN8Z0L8_RANTA|nr:unnamed protein product [Rangifer tarandus platyrhynchus]